MESAARRETMEEAGVRGTLEVSQDPSYRGRGRVAPLDLLYPSKESVDPPGVVEAPAIDVPHIPAPSMRPCSPLPLGTHHRAQPLPIQEPGLGLYVPPLVSARALFPLPPSPFRSPVWASSPSVAARAPTHRRGSSPTCL